MYIYYGNTHISDMLSITGQKGKEEAALERVTKISEAFTESPRTKATYEDIQNFNGYGAENGINAKRNRAGFFAQIRLILRRSLIDNKRNAALAVKFIQKFAMGLFVGILFYQSLYKEEFSEATRINNVNGALFYLVTEVSFCFQIQELGFVG